MQESEPVREREALAAKARAEQEQAREREPEVEDELLATVGSNVWPPGLRAQTERREDRHCRDVELNSKLCRTRVSDQFSKKWRGH